MRRLRNLAVIGAVAIVVCGVVFSNAASSLKQEEKPREPNRVVSVKPTSAIKEVSDKVGREPHITPGDLAAFGNELIRRKGFDYDFNVCEYLKATKQFSEADENSMAVKDYSCPLKLINGKPLTLRVRRELFGGMCAECFMPLSALRVTDKEMVIVVDGERYELQRPKDFELDEMYLVDESLRKVIRTWQMPYQTIPIGISPDGMKLYVDFYNSLGLDDLVLEVSESSVQFKARGEVALESEGEWIENFEKDPMSAYLAYKRFNVGGKSYIIKFEGPCT